jgi:hypothetical protein
MFKIPAPGFIGFSGRSEAPTFGKMGKTPKSRNTGGTGQRAGNTGGRGRYDDIRMAQSGRLHLTGREVEKLIDAA